MDRTRLLERAKVRILRFAATPDPEECWFWTGPVSPSGYGIFVVARKTHTAHRWSYLLFVGDVPDGMEVDHYVCDEPLCINPAHLKAVTRQENLARRRVWRSSALACGKGHLFTGDNTRFNKNGYRYCRECARLAAEKARRARGVAAR